MLYIALFFVVIALVIIAVLYVVSSAINNAHNARIEKDARRMAKYYGYEYNPAVIAKKK